MFINDDADNLLQLKSIRLNIFFKTKLSDPISPKSSPSDRIQIHNTAWAYMDSPSSTEIQNEPLKRHSHFSICITECGTPRSTVERISTVIMHCSVSLPWHCRGGRWWCVPSRSPALRPATHQETLTACQSDPTIHFVFQRFAHIWAVFWIRYDLVLIRILLTRSF